MVALLPTPSSYRPVDVDVNDDEDAVVASARRIKCCRVDDTPPPPPPPPPRATAAERGRRRAIVMVIASGTGVASWIGFLKSKAARPRRRRDSTRHETGEKRLWGRIRAYEVKGCSLRYFLVFLKMIADERKHFNPPHLPPNHYLYTRLKSASQAVHAKPPSNMVVGGGWGFALSARTRARPHGRFIIEPVILFPACRVAFFF